MSNGIEKVATQLSRLLTNTECSECPYLIYCRDKLYDKKDITLCDVLRNLVEAGK